MKRNGNKSQSPYQRHGKAPYRYSELYQRWSSATLSGKTGEARRLGAEHTRHFLGRTERRLRSAADDSAQHAERLAA